MRVLRFRAAVKKWGHTHTFSDIPDTKTHRFGDSQSKTDLFGHSKTHQRFRVKTEKLKTKIRDFS